MIQQNQNLLADKINTDISCLPMVVTKGSHYENGFQYGQSTKDRVQKFLCTELAHINLVRHKPIELSAACRWIAPHIKVIEEETPTIAEEIRGFADGAAISYEKAMLLQMRREVIGYGTECSTVGFSDNENGVVIAQNVELAGDLENKGLILQSQYEDVSLLQYVHVGLMGYLGINSHGIGIGINMVYSSGWKPGVSPYLLVRLLLQQKTIQDCMYYIKHVRRASSRSLTLTDGVTLLNVEMTVDEERIIEKPIILHTNHYLYEDFKVLDLGNRQSCTFGRMQQMQDFIKNQQQLLSIEKIKQLLSSHGVKTPICTHYKDAKKPSTVVSVILQPGEGKISVAKGPPCKSYYQDYNLTS